MEREFEVCFELFFAFIFQSEGVCPIIGGGGQPDHVIMDTQKYNSRMPKELPDPPNAESNCS
jgi:hypothetical protein